uniref:Uncharacterized protein n=1 Tax=Beihai levi-like virus 3 TaxID=1922416 RepID=A0A1L3KIA3_9VIRU|nr:hypothetical protein [Beihai levi-like virus 3]
MFANTLNFSIGPNTYTLDLVSRNGTESEYAYRGSLRSFSLKIRQGKDNDGTLRHNMFIREDIYATTDSLEETRSVSMTLREPPNGDPSVTISTIMGVLGLLAAQTTIEELVTVGSMSSSL